MKRFRMDRRIAAEVVVAAVASASIIGIAGIASAGTVSADDSRATIVQGNINNCGALPTLFTGGTGSGTQNGISVTVTHTGAATPNPFPANGWTTLPAGTDVLTVTLPAGQTLTGTINVKGGPGYNQYPGSALTSLIEPVNNGGNIAGLSHYIICGTLSGTTAKITVHKKVVGSGPGSGGPFSFEVTCDGGVDDLFKLSDGDTHTIDNLADGASCKVNEADSSSANSTSYTLNGNAYTANDSFKVSGGTTTAVVVTNTYTQAPPPTGSVKVTKSVTGTPPSGLGTFDISLDCGGTVTAMSLGDTDSQTVDKIPDGTSCTVTEPNNKNASVTTFTVDANAPAPTATFDVVGNHETDVTVTNEYDAATLVVKKVVTGTQTGNNTFGVHVDCGGNFIFNFTLGGGDSHTIDTLPGGSICAVTETDAQGATSTTYTVDGNAATAPATTTIGIGDTSTVEITNNYPVQTPSSPPVIVSSPPVIPSSPVITPSSPVITPSSPVITPSSPVVTPSSPSGDLTVVKAVDKTSANYGDNLHYTLTVTANGAPQTNVTVTDNIPDNTTYVSASCALPCTVGPPSGGTVTWNIGPMAAGESVVVELVVNITPPAAETGGPAETITNSGIAHSDQDPSDPSNVVKTGVTEVLGEKVHRHHHHKPQVKPTRTTRSSGSLPFTGLPASELAGGALLAIILGCALQFSTRRRREVPASGPDKRKFTGKHRI